MVRKWSTIGSPKKDTDYAAYCLRYTQKYTDGLSFLEVLNSSFYLEELNSSIERNYFLEEEEEEAQRSDVIEFLWFA